MVQSNIMERSMDNPPSERSSTDHAPVGSGRQRAQCLETHEQAIRPEDDTQELADLACIVKPAKVKKSQEFLADKQAIGARSSQEKPGHRAAECWSKTVGD